MLKFVIKYQKSGNTALEFWMHNITGIFAGNQAKGMITLTLSLKQDEKAQSKQSKNL
jgi:hypothetical protein